MFTLAGTPAEEHVPAEAHGVDRYGTPWMINSGMPQEAKASQKGTVHRIGADEVRDRRLPALAPRSVAATLTVGRQKNDGPRFPRARRVVVGQRCRRFPDEGVGLPCLSEVSGRLIAIYRRLRCAVWRKLRNVLCSLIMLAAGRQISLVESVPTM